MTEAQIKKNKKKRKNKSVIPDRIPVQRMIYTCNAPVAMPCKGREREDGGGICALEKRSCSALTVDRPSLGFDERNVETRPLCVRLLPHRQSFRCV